MGILENPEIRLWNARFSRPKTGAWPSPSPLLTNIVDSLSPGVALDVACGTGRHALALASRGWRCVAVDGSQVGIDKMLGEAVRRSCREGIEAHVADLETSPPGFIIEPNGFDLIADFLFLHRPLFEPIRLGLRPGGMFVASLHVMAPELPPRRFALTPGELEATVASWGFAILHSRQRAASPEHDSVAEIVAQRPP